MKKHISSPQYYKKFLCNRIPTILIPYLVINVVYWLYYTGTGKVYSIKQIMIATFQNGAPIAKFSWYIIVILLFYLCFWLLMTIFKKHYDYIIVSTFVLNVLYIIACRHLNYGIHWYSSVFTLCVGMIWAYKEADILKLFEKHFLISTISVVLCWMICYQSAVSIRISVLPIIFQNLSASLFSVIIVLFSMKFSVRSKVAHILGKLSLELYMVQGLSIMLTRSSKFYIENELLWCVVVLLLSILLASVFHFIFKKILVCYRNVCTKIDLLRLN